MTQATKRVIFVGRVQGVGFRFTAHRIAQRFHLTGWVRNAMDGTVEMIAQGSDEDINNCIEQIEQALKGYVTQTKIEQAPANPKYKDFKITF